MQVGLIACCSKKRNERSLAKDLYTSTLFKLSRLYVEQHGLDWWILSAKHGLLHPESVIDPYNLALKDMKKWDRLRWIAKVQDQLKKEVGTDVELLVLAGSLYREALRGWKVVDVLEGMRVGKRLAKLKDLTK